MEERLDVRCLCFCGVALLTLNLSLQDGEILSAVGRSSCLCEGETWWHSRYCGGVGKWTAIVF